MDLAVKVAAFCRELGNNTLQEMAQRDKKTDDAYKRAVKFLEDGQIGPGLEADLNMLDDMVLRIEGQGLFPGVTRAFKPMPDPGRGTGVQWWACPSGRCAGRGRVRPGQDPPVCAATGEQLVPGPLPG
jgi:hypothetical protein